MLCKYHEFMTNKSILSKLQTYKQFMIDGNFPDLLD